MTVLQYRLATCSYSQFKPEMGLPVRASLGGPRWWKKPIPREQTVFEIAPGRQYFKEPDDEVFHAKFRAQLDRIGVEHLIDRFNDVGFSAGCAIGDTLVAMCFEKLMTWDDLRCHRSMFRIWWLEQTGEQIPELGLPPDTPDAVPDLTLF